MNTISKISVAVTLSLGLFVAQSCVHDDDYAAPELNQCQNEAYFTNPENVSDQHHFRGHFIYLKDINETIDEMPAPFSPKVPPLTVFLCYKFKINSLKFFPNPDKLDTSHNFSQNSFRTICNTPIYLMNQFENDFNLLLSLSHQIITYAPGSVICN